MRSSLLRRALVKEGAAERRSFLFKHFFLATYIPRASFFRDNLSYFSKSNVKPRLHAFQQRHPSISSRPLKT